MVRLEVCNHTTLTNRCQVSIPVWFDWKLRIGNIVSHTNDKFQFQYGSIGSCAENKGLLHPCKVSIPVWFDWKASFNKKMKKLWHVSIPVWFDWKWMSRGGRWWCISFNSSMVRLEVYPWKAPAWRLWWFQFQYGSIGRVNILAIIFLFAIVSIPVWFDWKCMKNE